MAEIFKKKLTTELKRLSEKDYCYHPKKNVVVVLDNIRSMHNVGAAFRVADAFLIKSIYLCGITAIPPRNEISKTALGAEEHVAWEYHQKTKDAINKLKDQDFSIVSIEQVHGSIPLENFEIDKNRKYAIVFGHEVNGIDSEVVKKSDYCCEISQYGVKHSLNVSVALGIICWKFTV